MATLKGSWHPSPSTSTLKVIRPLSGAEFTTTVLWTIVYLLVVVSSCTVALVESVPPGETAFALGSELFEKFDVPDELEKNCLSPCNAVISMDGPMNASLSRVLHPGRPRGPREPILRKMGPVSRRESSQGISRRLPERHSALPATRSIHPISSVGAPLFLLFSPVTRD